MAARLKEMYTANEVAPALMKKFNYKSPHADSQTGSGPFDQRRLAGDAKDNTKVIDNRR